MIIFIIFFFLGMMTVGLIAGLIAVSQKEKKEEKKFNELINTIKKKNRK